MAASVLIQALEFDTSYSNVSVPEVIIATDPCLDDWRVWLWSDSLISRYRGEEPI